MLLGACLCVSFWQSSATKVCQKYVNGGVTVDYSKNKVTFPAVHNPPVPVKLAQEYDKKGLDAFFELSASFMNTVQKNELPQLKKGKDNSFLVYLILDCLKIDQREIENQEIVTQDVGSVTEIFKNRPLFLSVSMKIISEIDFNRILLGPIFEKAFS